MRTAGCTGRGPAPAGRGSTPPDQIRLGPKPRRALSGRLRTLASLVALGPWLSACYVYQPVGVSELAPGDEVRVRVTTEAVARADTAVAIDRDVEGLFAGVDGEDFLLDVAVGAGDTGFRNSALNQRIDLRTQDVLDIERRSLDQTRTAIVLAIVGGVAAAAALAAFSESGGNTSTPPPTPGDGIVVQVLRLAVPWAR